MLALIEIIIFGIIKKEVRKIDWVDDSEPLKMEYTCQKTKEMFQISANNPCRHWINCF